MTDTKSTLWLGDDFKISCENCAYFSEGKRERNRKTFLVFECRRYPPVNLYFQITKPIWFCGEFVRRDMWWKEGE